MNRTRIKAARSPAHPPTVEGKSRSLVFRNVASSPVTLIYLPVSRPRFSRHGASQNPEGKASLFLSRRLRRPRLHRLVADQLPVAAQLLHTRQFAAGELHLFLPRLRLLHLLEQEVRHPQRSAAGQATLAKLLHQVLSTNRLVHLARPLNRPCSAASTTSGCEKHQPSNLGQMRQRIRVRVEVRAGAGDLLPVAADRVFRGHRQRA